MIRLSLQGSQRLWGQWPLSAFTMHLFLALQLLLLCVAATEYIEQKIFIDTWFMDRGIASDESRMALPPFNPPKPFEWYKKRGNGVWDLRVNEEAEAVMQAQAEQKKLELNKLEELEKKAVAAARVAEQK